MHNLIGDDITRQFNNYYMPHFYTLYCWLSVDLTANELLHQVFPDDESKKEALNLSPER